MSLIFAAGVSAGAGGACVSARTGAANFGKINNKSRRKRSLPSCNAAGLALTGGCRADREARRRQIINTLHRSRLKPANQRLPRAMTIAVRMRKQNAQD